MICVAGKIFQLVVSVEFVGEIMSSQSQFFHSPHVISITAVAPVC